jgi:hypothetical protein
LIGEGLTNSAIQVEKAFDFTLLKVNFAYFDGLLLLLDLDIVFQRVVDAVQQVPFLWFLLSKALGS